MRKAIIAAIVATALFAVGAFAASFTLSAEDVASGSNDVTSCASHVDVDFGEPRVGDTTTGDYVVDGATIRLYTGTGPTAPAATLCQGFTAELAVGTGTSVTPPFTYTEYDATGTVDATGAIQVSFGTPISVSSIRAASVVIDGKTLTANL